MAFVGTFRYRNNVGVYGIFGKFTYCNRMSTRRKRMSMHFENRSVRHRNRCRLTLEQLEERTLLSVGGLALAAQSAGALRALPEQMAVANPVYTSVLKGALVNGQPLGGTNGTFAPNTKPSAGEALAPSTKLSVSDDSTATPTVVYSDLSPYEYAMATGGLIAYDDYDAITGQPGISLSQVTFAGGVEAAGGILDFEFFAYPQSPPAVPMVDLRVGFSQSGDYYWTLTLPQPITIPNNGVLAIYAEPGTTGHWYAGNAGPTIGTQDPFFGSYWWAGLSMNFQLTGVGCGSLGNGLGYTPAQIAAAYGFSSINVNSVAGDGSGQTIAIIDAFDDPTIASDLSTFDAAFNLPDPPSFIKLNQLGSADPSSLPPPSSSTDDWSFEESLDVEWAHAVAPQANIVVIEANTDSDADLFTAVNTAETISPAVSVVSMSFGGPEFNTEAQADSLFTTPDGHTGMTFVASSGDGGAVVSSAAPAVSYPAASSNVLAVGGTNMTFNGNGYAGETAWSNGGGGQSLYESEPAYQNGVQHSGNRQVPDASFDANPNTGVPIYTSYDYGAGAGWFGIGGTSLAAPCWAGLIAIIDQLRVGQGLGTLDGATQTLPDLYSLPSTDFHQVTSGYNSGYPGYGFSSAIFGPVNNGYPDSGFAATLGYNEVTGLGTPVANQLVSDFFDPVATATTLSVSAGATTYGQPLTITAMVAVDAPQTGTPTGGTVTFMDGTTTIGSAPLTDGTATVTLASLPAGSDTLTASYSGDGSSFAASSTNGQAATLVTVAGGGSLATTGTSFSPFGAAIDSSGNLYIADPKDNVVLEVNVATGAVTPFAGNGTAGYSGDGGPAAAAELDAPAGVAVDSSGDVFIADTNNSVIREVNHSTGLIATVAGNGTYGYNGDGIAATAAELDLPTAVAVDSSGNLFIADTANSLIREVNTSQIISTVAGYVQNGTAGNYGYYGDGIAATSAELGLPMGVAVDSSGDIYIADTNNDVIRMVDSAGIISTIAGNAGIGVGNYSGDNGPATAAELSYPVNVTLDGSNHLFIADYGNDRVREIDLSSGVITSVAGGGLIDNGPANAAALNGPAATAADASGHLYIADYGNNCVRQLTLSTGLISTVAGLGISGASGDNGPGTAAALDYPTATAVDNAGNLFIADEYSQRVREVNLASGVITTVAGNGTAGYSGDNQQATAAELDDPTGVALDGAGDLFIADAANNCVREVNLATGVITTVAGDGTAGYSGDNQQATAAELDHPTAVAVDGAGNLFIADTANNCIREVNLASGVITTVAGDGTAGYNGDGIAATAAELNAPSSVAVSTAGNLLIADTDNNRIRLVDLSSNVITTVAGNGIAGYSGDNGQATAASIDNPLGIAADASGNLYISDTANNAIREVNSAGMIVTLTGNSAAGYRPNNVPAAAGTFDGPAGLAVDDQGDLFIADPQNDLVRQLGAATSVSVAMASLTVTGVAANSKVYDGTTAATLNLGNAMLVGVFGNDNVTLVTDSATGTFADKNAGMGKVVTVAGLTITGTDSGNYCLIQPTTTANITPQPLTVTASDESKIYGQANPTFTASYTGFVSGDTQSVLSGSPTFSTTAVASSPVGNYTITVAAGTLSAQNYTFNFVNGTLSVVSSNVVGRYIFYNNSAFNDYQTAPSPDDDNAIAPGLGTFSSEEPGVELGKTALLPGQTATFANYTSYSKGINGIMIDVDQLGNAAALNAADFQFLVGNVQNVSQWVQAPAPESISVRTKDLGDGVVVDRITIIWADYNWQEPGPQAGTIAKEWLQVTVLPTPDTGLAEPDVFYWGNAIGETGNSTTNAQVSPTDEIAVRNHPQGVLSPAPIYDPYDFNRDTLVSATDQLIVRDNPTALSALILLTAPVASQPQTTTTAALAGVNGPTTSVAGVDWPTLSDGDAGGTYHGSPFPATATVAGVVPGVDTTPAASLEGVSPTLTYYVGSTVSGSGSTTAPSAAGTYTVVASFAGSIDYPSAQSSPVTFTIAQATPTISVADSGGICDGSPFPATATVAGVLTGVDTTPAASLEGISPTLTYYVGSTVSGSGSTTAPSAAGTYTVVASFAGSLDYPAAQSSPVTFTIAQATPTINVADTGGIYNGSPFPATAAVAGVLTGVDTTPAASLEGISPTLTYYVGSTVSGSGSTTAPSAAGTYTVVASFAGSTDYAAAQSGPVIFTIAQATPTISVADTGGICNGSPFPATAAVAGVVTGVDTTPAASLEGVSPTLTYYVGSTVSGSGSATPPSAAGTYTVVASFAGSADYVAVQSSPVTFTIVNGQIATPGLYDPASSWWYLRNSNTAGGAEIMAGYGPAGGNWIPLVGDWTGNGTDTLGLYNPATGFFYLHNSNTTGTGDITFFYGDPGQGWIPVVGDWTGRTSSAGFPIDTVGLYDPKTCTWYLRNSLTTGVADITIGYGPAGAGWLPVVGDWDGNGTTTVGLYNPATGYFYLHNSNTTGTGEIAFFYGDPRQNWIPVAGDWTGSGRDSIGLYDPASGTWYLRNSLSTGVADMTFGFGSPGSGWLPVVGDWTGTSGAAVQAAGGVLSPATASTPLSQADLQPIVTAAIARWPAAGANSTELAAMTQATYVVTDLPGAELGPIAGNTIDVDQNAAGLSDLDASATSLMSEILPTGVQQQPGANEVDAIFAEPGTL
jgi:hypothetical protein